MTKSRKFYMLIPSMNSNSNIMEHNQILSKTLVFFATEGQFYSTDFNADDLVIDYVTSCYLSSQNSHLLEDVADMVISL